MDLSLSLFITDVMIGVWGSHSRRQSSYLIGLRGNVYIAVVLSVRGTSRRAPTQHTPPPVEIWRLHPVPEYEMAYTSWDPV